MFIDTHCHFEERDFEDIDKEIEDMRYVGVNKFIVSGCTRAGIDAAIKLSKKYDGIYLTIGYHPSEIRKVNDGDFEYLKKAIKNNKLVVGIGEIGLDYHYTANDSELQIALFEKQLKLAEELNLPVVIHSRDATHDTLKVLKRYKVRGVIHCFSGSYETALRYIKLGFYLGVGGVLTFTNSKLYKVIEKVPIENIVLETDSPYLTPHPFRGNLNTPKYIPVIAQKLASIKNMSLEEVGEITSRNAINLFDLK